MKIDKRYLAISAKHAVPGDENIISSKLRFFEAGRQIYDLDISVSENREVSNVYYDMGNFTGRDITIECDKATSITLTDDIDHIVNGCERPFIQFTAKTGWLNDPNGLVFYEGKYHMFYQNNPLGRIWSNMHWGHAVSEDLLHWEHCDIALFPDEIGDMFSGSAVIDHDNRTGLKECEHDVVLLFYTAAGGKRELNAGKPFTQCLAYSTDGMKTFKKYTKNPIIPHIKGENRDPKVIYHRESDSYVMSLYLEKGEFCFLKSENLTNWSEIGRYQHTADRECPDLYRFGDKYVLISANDYYVVGSFDINKGFIPETEPVKIGYASTYASQSFFGTDDCIRVAWNQYGRLPSKVYNGTISMPYKMELDGTALRNIPLITSEEKPIFAYDSFDENDIISLQKDAYDIEFALCGDNEITLFGNLFKISDGKLTFTAEVNGNTYEMPVGNKLRIITDIYGTAIFTNNYEAYGTFQTINRFDNDSLRVKNAVTALTIRKVMH